MTDYYPFGSIANHWGKEEESYRFGYQGQFAEEDEETGFNHFEARAYDPVIGRWMVPDPVRQYYSPYIGMGNNPVSRFDPNGGEDLTGDAATVALSEQYAATASSLKFQYSPLGQVVQGFQQLPEAAFGDIHLEPATNLVLFGKDGPMSDNSHLPEPDPDATSNMLDIDLFKELIRVFNKTPGRDGAPKNTPPDKGKIIKKTLERSLNVTDVVDLEDLRIMPIDTTFGFNWAVVKFSNDSSHRTSLNQGKVMTSTKSKSTKGQWKDL